MTTTLRSDKLQDVIDHLRAAHDAATKLEADTIVTLLPSLVPDLDQAIWDLLRRCEIAARALGSEPPNG